MRSSVLRSAAIAAALAVSFGCSAATEPGGPSTQKKAIDSLTIMPSTLTLSVGESSHLLARFYRRGKVDSSQTIAWTTLDTSIAKVTASGDVSARAVGQTQIVAAGAAVADSTLLVVVAAVNPTATISMQVSRLTATSGPVLVSSGVPLPPGRLQASDLSKVRVLVAGQEPSAVYVEGLAGTHSDGSLRSLLVQFNYDVPANTGVSAQLTFGVARTAAALPKPAANRGSPDAVILPTDPNYLVSTGMAGATLTVDSTVLLGANFQKYETDFRTFADYHWNLSGPAWAEDYYDRAKIYYVWWMRSGNTTYWNRATQMAVAYRRDYVESSNYSPAAHWSQMEGLELHYLLTGDEASRYAVGRVADYFNLPYYMDNLDDPTAEMENRMQARTLMALLTAWKINAPSQAGASWASLLPKALGNILLSQAPSGAYLFTRTNNQCSHNKPFMVGQLNDAFINYYTYFSADSRIPASVQRAVDYMWTNDWGASAQSFIYLDGPCPGYDEGQAYAPDLNNLIINGYAFTYQRTGNTVYRDRADQIFAGAVNGSYLQGTKQFNQEYTSSYRYFNLRR